MMQRLAILALMGLAAAVLGGCAGMSEEECVMSDWRTVGYEDGLLGRSGAAIGTYRRECASAGVTPDFDAYQAGRKEGLQEFCRPQNGYLVGERGGRYNGVCPDPVEAAFLRAYDEGRTLFTLRQDVSQLESALAQAERDIAGLEASIAEDTVRMVGDGLTPEDRLRILADTRRMAAEKEALIDEADRLAAELAASRDRLYDYEEMQASR